MNNLRQANLIPANLPLFSFLFSCPFSYAISVTVLHEQKERCELRLATDTGCTPMNNAVLSKRYNENGHLATFTSLYELWTFRSSCGPNKQVSNQKDTAKIKSKQLFLESFPLAVLKDKQKRIEKSLKRAVLTWSFSIRSPAFMSFSQPHFMRGFAA